MKLLSLLLERHEENYEEKEIVIEFMLLYLVIYIINMFQTLPVIVEVDTSQATLLRDEWHGIVDFIYLGAQIVLNNDHVAPLRFI